MQINITPKKITIATLSFIAIAAMLYSALTPKLPPMEESLQTQVDAIRIAQRENARLLPQLNTISTKVEANTTSANNGRSYICKYYKEYCTTQFLDPEDAGIDLSPFLVLAPSKS